MVKNLTCLEIVKGDRIFRFTLDGNSPLGECYDALTEMRAFVIEKIQEATAAQEQQTEDKCQDKN